MTTSLPETMTAVVATPSGERWAELRDVPLPDPAPNEALIQVHAVGINRGELHLLRIRDGWIPGQDHAGVVVRAAADGSGPDEGARVAGLADWHAWAGYVAVPTERLAVLPETIDFASAAALPMAGTTALNLLRAGGGDLLGRNVLVTGASGGVGGFAVQLAGLAGANVTGVSAVTDDAPGDQDLILESVGGTSLEKAIEKVGRRGTVVVFGNSSQEPSSIGFLDFAGGRENARLQSYFSFAYADRAGANLSTLADLVATGRLAVAVGYEGALAAVNDALDAFADRRFKGKAVLRVT